MKQAAATLPDMVLGAGTIIDVAQARDFHAAGVHCVGMGSHLVDAQTRAEGNVAELAERTRRLTAILATV